MVRVPATTPAEARSVPMTLLVSVPLVTLSVTVRPNVGSVSVRSIRLALVKVLAMVSCGLPDVLPWIEVVAPTVFWNAVLMLLEDVTLRVALFWKVPVPPIVAPFSKRTPLFSRNRPSRVRVPVRVPPPSTKKSAVPVMVPPLQIRGPLTSITLDPPRVPVPLRSSVPLMALRALRLTEPLEIASVPMASMTVFPLMVRAAPATTRPVATVTLPRVKLPVVAVATPEGPAGMMMLTPPSGIAPVSQLTMLFQSPSPLSLVQVAVAGPAGCTLMVT